MNHFKNLSLLKAYAASLPFSLIKVTRLNPMLMTLASTTLLLIVALTDAPTFNLFSF
ncbi:hypothetical protein [Helicobacter pylori]|uniref:hypothetical protein n=1 Tax=Helicobacter pylori TaxID=210 RepID=UPI0038B37B95